MRLYSNNNLKRGVMAFWTIMVCMALSTQAQQKAQPAVTTNKLDQTTKSVMFGEGSSLSIDKVQDVFEQYLGIDGSMQRMVFDHKTTTKQRLTSSRYYQYFKGLKVELANYNVICKADKIQYISGNVYKVNNSWSTVPTLNEAQALRFALKEVNASLYRWQEPAMEATIKKIYNNPDTSYFPKGRLVWMEDFRQGEGDRKLRLAYAFDIFASVPMSHQVIYIDAKSGGVLLSNDLMHHTDAVGTSKYSRNVPIVTSRIGASYMLYDSTRGNGIWTMNYHHDSAATAITDIFSVTNAWPATTDDTVAIDAHWATERIYDFFKTQINRWSYDDLNGILLSYVNYRSNPTVGYNNAFWDGVEMIYGDGTGSASGGFDALVSLDVAAHEIGHGLCQTTANLVYRLEPGALNEGFSDCWAAAIEYWANPYETDAVSKKTWYLGEELKRNNPLRRLDSPKLKNLPDTYTGTYWYNVVACTPTTANDKCGVHTNSGVMVKWFYLVVQGAVGTNDLGNSYNVRGIGMTNATDILYLTELSMASTDDYAAARAASINAAATLFGPCSREVETVTNAWYAVGVGAPYTYCTPQVGFVRSTGKFTENAGTTACPASRVIQIGMRALGSPITGGNPVVNIVASSSSTAVAGVDYTLTGGSMTFAAGDTTTQFATLTIFDNAIPADSKTLALGFTFAAMGSTAIMSPSMDSMIINIENDDTLPKAGNDEYHTLNSGTTATSNASSAFFGSYKRAHSQFLLFASELNAAGVKAGVPINQIAFNVVTKNSTAPFINYTVGMCNTRITDLNSTLTGPMTPVYTGNHTTNLGIDSIPFNLNTFAWDGVSNVAVEICFGANTAAFAANDILSGISAGSTTVCQYDRSNTGTGAGCDLPGAFVATDRPVVRFKQTVPPTTIETVLSRTRTWNVRSGTSNYFYNRADSNLIAAVAGSSHDLGCVSATVTGAGVGFATSSFGSSNRSLKEITITPTINSTVATSTATIYLTTTELNGVAPSTLFLLKTTATTDATVNTSNTVIITPTLITGNNYTGFRGTFTGFGRYFLVTSTSLCAAPTAVITPVGSTSFCTGGSVLLNASTGTGYTYQWTLGGTNIAGATNNNYTASVGGNYQVVVTASGCSATSSIVAVTVTAPPSTPATIGGVTTTCISTPVTLTNATTGGTWSSSNTSIATIHPTTGLLSGLAVGSATITYTMTNSCGTAFTVHSMTITSTPTIPPIFGFNNVCQGSNITLTNATTGGTWSSSNSAIATISTSGVVSGLTTGSVTISYAVTTACGTGYATHSLTVQANPTPGTTSGSLSTCIGSSTTLTNTVSGGAWSSSNTAIATVNSAGLVTGVATGTCTITYTITNAFGCTATTLSTFNVASAGPTATITPAGATTFCVGDSVRLDASTGTGYTYQWLLGGIPITGATNASYTARTGGSYTVRVTSGACGTLSAARVITVNATTVGANTGASAVCVGQTITLSNSTTGGTWTSSNTTIATVTSAGVVTGATAGAVTISYSISSSCGSASATSVITVNALPTVAAITGTTTGCGGSTNTLSSATSGGVWSSSNTAICTIHPTTGVATGVSIGTATISYTYTNTAGCSATTTATYTVSGGPTATITPAGATSFCAGGSVVLNANTGSGLTYQWQYGGTNITGATNASYTASVGGNYNVVVTSGSCQNVSATTTITILTTTVPAITSATTNVCEGGTLNLSNTATGGTWSVGSSTLATVSSAGVLTGITAGTVVVSYTISGACGLGSATTTITVRPQPTVSSIAGAAYACIGGGTVTVTNATTGGTWSSSNTTVATISGTGVVSPVSLGTTTLSYMVTNGFGCSRAATSTFTVSNPPTVSIAASGVTTFCSGGYVVLSASGATGSTYQWQIGGTNIAGATNSAYTASVTGNFGVVITSGTTGCSASSSTVIPVTVTSGTAVTPTVTISAVPGTIVCTSTGAVAFSSTITNGGTTPAYQWMVNGVTVGSGTTYSYTPTDGDVVACKLRSNATCAFPDTAIQSVNMVVSAIMTPALTISVTPGTTVCTGSVATFGANPVSGGSSPTYVWRKNGIPVGSSSVFYFTPAEGDQIKCTMTSNYPCRTTDTAESATTTMHVLPNSIHSVTITASRTTVGSGQVVTFTANSVNGGSSPAYQWYIDAVAVPGETGRIFVTTTLRNGQVVSCRVVSSDPCASPTLTSSTGITMTVTSGLASTSNQQRFFTLIPNPNAGNFTISGQLPISATSEVRLQVTNMLGQLVHTELLSVQQGKVQASVQLGQQIANGVYIVSLHTDYGIEQFHMVLEQ